MVIALDFSWAIFLVPLTLNLAGLSYTRPFKSLLTWLICHTTIVTLSVYSYLDLLLWLKNVCNSFPVIYYSHTIHIWYWCNHHILSWLMTVNWQLLLVLDSKLISIAHFIQAIKVNIVPSLTNSSILQSRHSWLFQLSSGVPHALLQPIHTKCQDMFYLVYGLLVCSPLKIENCDSLGQPHRSLQSKCDSLCTCTR